MTAFMPPTSGQVFIQGGNVVTDKMKLASEFSYCPQENTLFDQLTVREHFHLFSALRGIPRASQGPLAESLISEVDLEQHAGKKTHELSGGNKRKLNLALALLDYKPVIFLDEPSSGMDPGVRRRSWECIRNAVARGCCVVLTSHNMDECEALCHRLVIMAAGKICCIGSVQYLKGKFGNMYKVKIKLHSAQVGEDRGVAMEQLKKIVLTSLVGSWMTEEHENIYAPIRSGHQGRHAFIRPVQQTVRMPSEVSKIGRRIRLVASHVGACVRGDCLERETGIARKPEKANG